MASSASSVTIIGRATRVRGRIVGESDLEVLGFVEGEIAVGGDVTIDATGIVGASVQGRKLVVRGAVKGDLVGEEAVLLEEGARVVGDVRAPRVAIAPGALVRGYVQTGHGGSAPARQARTHSAAAPARPAQAAPAASLSVKAASASPGPSPKAATASAPVVRRPEAAPAAQASDRSLRRPPPPVVPVMKKAKGQMAKKKER
jgi:cytoskeletal protein CcmA (bactofilin family)